MAAKLGFLESTSVHIVNGRTVCLEAKKIRERNLTTSNNFDVILDMFFDNLFDDCFVENTLQSCFSSILLLQAVGNFKILLSNGTYFYFVLL